MLASRVVIILLGIAAFSARAEHRREIAESHPNANEAPAQASLQDSPQDSEGQAVPPQLEQAVRRAEQAIQTRNQQELLSAIMLLLPYYYAENPPSADTSETDQLLRELLSQRASESAPPPPVRAKDEEQEFFNAVGKKEAKPPVAAQISPSPREAGASYGGSIEAQTNVASVDNAPDAAPPIGAATEGSDPITAPPANKRKARAKSKSVATRLMASLLDSLKQSKMADAAAKEPAMVGAKIAPVAAPKLATLTMLPTRADAETAPAVVQKAAATNDRLNWLGWAVVFFLLALRQLHWMTTRGRKRQ